MLIYRRETEKTAAILSRKKSGKRLWMHISGSEGGEKSYFIDSIVQESFQNDLLLLRFDFSMFPYHTPYFVQIVLRRLFLDHQRAFRSFLSSYPGGLQKQIHQFYITGPVAEERSPGNPKWYYQLLSSFIDHLSLSRRVLIILEEISGIEFERLGGLLQALEKTQKPRLVLITSGKEEPQFSLTGFDRYSLILRKLSVRETEKLVKTYLDVDSITARLITNHLYIKSGGLVTKVKMLLEGYYSRLSLKDPVNVENSGILHRIPAGITDEQLFSALMGQLSDEALDILAFLSRLEDPFPTPLLLKILKGCGVGKEELKGWLQKGFFQEETFLKKPYVFIKWSDWKAFLRRQTSVERLENILAILKKILPLPKSPLPLQLSTLYFEAGDIVTALGTAYQEANFFRKVGEYYRALDQYSFLKRNMQRHPDSGIRPADVFREMGELQKVMGLYENAFESFREMSECLRREDREEWIYATLQMADSLFQMDALSEARYLIQELKIKKFRTRSVRAFANILMGELEKNFGHNEYATRHFETALEMLSGVRDDELKFRLYSILKEIYSKTNQREAYRKLVERVHDALNPASPYRQYLQLDLVKHLLKHNDFQGALPLMLTLRREAGQCFLPETFAQIQLYSAEIYAYFSKWHLSRSHLRRILNTGFLMPHPGVQLQTMLHLGVVEKEIGYFGSALHILQEALRIARRYSSGVQFYQIKIHLGHIYLLTHSFVRAREHLLETLEWAEENRHEELLITAALFLSSYELQQQRFKTAKKYLDKARQTIALLDAPIDQLNYYYYLSHYALKTGQIEKAAKIVHLWEGLAQGIVKFENLVLWISGKVLIEQERFPKAASLLLAALQRSLHYRLPHLEFQILKDLTVLAKRQGKPDLFDKYFVAAEAAFHKLLKAVGDEILQKQIEESGEYDYLVTLKSDR